MSSEIFARVIFDSPLPALSREFEYVVPESLRSQIEIGLRVSVRFANQSKQGFVVGLSDVKEFAGSVSEILAIVSPVPVLKEHIYRMLQAIADRQCCTIGELLSNAVPRRFTRVEKSFAAEPFIPSAFEPGLKFAEIVSPVCDSTSGTPRFLRRLAEIASDYFQSGRSVIICVPDFRDMARLVPILTDFIPAISLTVQSADATGSEKYLGFLAQLSAKPRVVLGTRSAMYSPVFGNAAIVIWDDGDTSHQDQQSPYLTTREIALIRQGLFDAPLHFLSHSRSTEVQRLVNLKFLQDVQANSWRPKVSLSEGSGLDGMSFKLIKKGLASGPVLVQVASPGTSRSLYCASCSERSSCGVCNGPLWLNAQGQIVCRWCGKLNLNFQCSSCGHAKLRHGAAGVTRWVERLGKSFPGVPVREVTAEQQENEIPNRPIIVVCTAGIEPVAKGGYAAVALLDCSAQLNIDSLRAPEDAMRGWLNALSFMRESGEAVAVGVSDEVSASLSLGSVAATVEALLQERESLGFPPSRRFLSATGAQETLEGLADSLATVGDVRVLGIARSANSNVSVDSRLLASFTYGAGAQVSETVRAFIGGLTAKDVRVSSKSGRSLRPVTIKFDDPRVI